MSIFESLYNAASDNYALDAFLKESISELADFCSENLEKQKIELDNFERFILFKTKVIEDLDYSQSYNRAFVCYLMDYCERFCSTSAVVHLYRIIKQENLNVGSRMDAAMLYLYNVPDNQVFVDRFEDICAKIQTAINEEDDDDSKAKATFLNYYSYVVYNTNHIKFAKDIQSKYCNHIKRDSFPFLRCQLIKDCLSLDISNSEDVFRTIQNAIDELLGRKQLIGIQTALDDDCIIEDNTTYAEILAENPKSFLSIWNISGRQFSMYENRDEIFYSLGRGVKILEEEAQLYSYIYSYGKMHNKKMLSALKELPVIELEGKCVEIFDWACGQGLASIIFCEFISNIKINLKVNRLVLIEPSEIALKRAALHIRHFDKQCAIKTVLKDLDSIINSDIKSSNDAIKIHLFSNILDVENFSMQNLISQIEQTQKGINYFICVSPYITDAKTARIDEFVLHFASTYDSYHSYIEIDNQKGEWEGNWTRVIRVFKVII